MSDNVALGGYIVLGSTFAVVDEASGILRSNVPSVSGIMGLGFQAISSSGAIPVSGAKLLAILQAERHFQAWQVLAAGSTLSQPLFSFALKSATSNSASAPALSTFFAFLS